MAKSKSTNTLPPRDVIAKRVEAQRQRVWHAQAICSITSVAARGLTGPGNNFSQDVWVAMEAVGELLDSIAGKLEGDVVLDAREEDARDEEAQS